MKSDATVTFGEFFESVRQKRGLTLRDFCKAAGADPGNISRMERGVVPPPKKRNILERYADALGLKEGSDDWYAFFDLAAVAKGHMPEDLLKDEELLKRLPAFFRTIRGQKPTPDEMQRIAEKIRGNGGK